MTAAPTSAAKCQLVAGIILRRVCGQAATSTCARCRRAVCESHVRHLKSAVGATADVCTECMPRGQSTIRTSTSPSFMGSSTGFIGGTWIDSSSSSPIESTQSWTDDAGGSFGGGGATGGWGDAPASAPTPDAAGFSPQDYAAFDAVTESDKDAGAPGYDS